MTGAWLIAAALTGREGAQQYFFGQTWSMEGVGRVTSFYPSATAFGIYAGRGLSLALVLAIFLPKQAWRWRVAAALLSVSIGLGVLFSFARGAWIGVFVALLVVALVSRFKPFLVTMLSLTAAGAALALVVMLKLATIPVLTAERITSMFDFDTPDNTAVSRIRIWQAALRVIGDHPFTGIGQDQFLRVDPKYGVPHVRFLTVSHPHNWILDFWLRLGIPGVAWMFVALGYFFYTVTRLWGRFRGTALGALALGLLASMVDFAVHGLMDMAYFTMDLALTFWLTVALVAIMQRLKPEEVDSALP
jgi:O-antigen ligase